MTRSAPLPMRIARPQTKRTTDMSGPNRGRLTILKGGLWRLYTHPIAGWEMLGTVQRGMEIGALGRSPVGIYAQINAGVARMLDQRKIEVAIKGGA